MDVIEELDDPHVPIAQACAALGVSRATLYRQTQPATPPALPEPAPSPRRLSDPERQAVLDVLHGEELVDQPPPEVYATLLSRGVYLASIRTMYRLLARSGESGERRAQRGPMTPACLKPVGMLRPAIALCRCMNIPARCCTGYLGDIGVPPPHGPMDFSGWFEAYIGGSGTPSPALLRGWVDARSTALNGYS
ncbi:hypothetical protein BE11_35850 [Sorangium cellulosum]|nr:hypothetical protein BE11_35850 [Sorangium cellulosum]